MSSNEEIDAKIVEEPFRVGWPGLTYLPSGIGKRCNYAQMCDLLGGSEGVRAFRDFAEYQVRFVTWNISETRSSHLPKKVVLVSTKWIDSDRRKWRQTAVLLVQKLQELQVYDDPIGVEIREYAYPRLMPIEADEDVLSVWESAIAPKAMSIMDEESTVWQGLSLVRHGSFDSPECPMTILIDAAHAEHEHWKPVATKIETAMQELQSPVSTVTVWQAQDPSHPECEMDSSMWKEPTMEVGHGCAAEGVVDSTGTLGGFLTLMSRTGKDTRLMLTSFDAVNSAKVSKALESDCGSAKSLSFSNSPSAYPVKVPSDLDFATQIRKIDEEITELERLWDTTRRDRSAFKEVIAARQKEKEEILAVKDQDRPAGNLRATSGFQLCHGDGKTCSLNWALLNIDPSRPYEDDFLLPSRGLARERRAVQWSLGHPTWALLDDYPTYSGMRRKFKTVVKVGRTTAWTHGRVNFATCFWKRTLQRCGASQAADGQPKYGEVLNCFRVEPYTEHGNFNEVPFAEPGDSDAIVRDEKTGAWIGLVFDFAWGCALMTPIVNVIKSIEEVTGEKVIVPHPIG
ncbi:hypothetical protein HDK77DRAFT_496473 [Phyllosticta capitalensis]